MSAAASDVPRVLIVEDERIFALDLRSRLEGHGFEVVGTAAAADAAVTLARARRPDVVLMDIHLDGPRDGIAAAEEIGRELRIPVVFLTAFAEEEVLRRARGSLPYGYLVKPCETSELVATLYVVAARRSVEVAVESSENRLRLALEVAGMGVWEWHPGEDRFFTSGAITKVFGDGAEPVGNGLGLFLERFPEAERDRIGRALMESGAVDGVFRFQRTDGTEGSLLVHGKSFDAQGGGRVVGVIKDMTEKLRAEARLRQAKVVFDATDDGIVITDRERRVLSVNPAFVRLTGFAESEMQGQELESVVVSHAHGDEFFAGLLGRPGGAWHGEVVCRRKDGSRFSAWEHVATVFDVEGQPTNYVVTLADVSAMREVEAQLAFLAHHDALTGLANRILLHDRIEQVLARARRDGARFAVLFIDLDNFKVINDTLGHEAGDSLLKAVALRIREQLRQSDTVARLGGDEFTVVVERIEDLGAVAQLATKLLDVVARPCRVAGESVSVTASIGVAFYPEDGGDAVGLLKAADNAMYHAKASGRNVFVFYAKDMAHRASERLAVEQGLRRALDADRLELHYQPLIDLATRQVLGVEALVRWREPEGLIPPSRFIPIAEQTSLIERLGAWVLDRACRQAANWRVEGLPDIRLAVNVSPRQLARPDFEGVVRAALERWPMPAGTLELEITESALQAVEESRSLLATLRQLGISFAIDDFGTGYSSLSVLEQLPVDRLKIDRSFVADLAARDSSRAICRAIVGLGRTLGLRTLAEGIETPEQLDLLRELGCEEGQGYGICRPLPADEFAAWLAARHRLTGPAGAG